MQLQNVFLSFLDQYQYDRQNKCCVTTLCSSLVRVRKTCFCLNYLFCCHKPGWRCPKVCLKLCLVLSLQTWLDCEESAGGLLKMWYHTHKCWDTVPHQRYLMVSHLHMMKHRRAPCNSTTIPSTSQHESKVTEMYCECDMTHSVDMTIWYIACDMCRPHSLHLAEEYQFRHTRFR